MLAAIRVGGATEVEVKERKDRVECHARDPCSSRGALPEAADSLTYDWRGAGCDACLALYSAGSPLSL
jgi:hypothetical protein